MAVHYTCDVCDAEGKSVPATHNMFIRRDDKDIRMPDLVCSGHLQEAVQKVLSGAWKDLRITLQVLK